MTHVLTDEQIASIRNAKRIVRLKLFNTTDGEIINGVILLDPDDEAPKAVVRNGRVYYFETKLTIDDIHVYIEGDQPHVRSRRSNRSASLNPRICRNVDCSERYSDAVGDDRNHHTSIC